MAMGLNWEVCCSDWMPLVSVCLGSGFDDMNGRHESYVSRSIATQDIIYDSE